MLSIRQILITVFLIGGIVTLPFNPQLGALLLIIPCLLDISESIDNLRK